MVSAGAGSRPSRAISTRSLPTIRNGEAAARGRSTGVGTERGGGLRGTLLVRRTRWTGSRRPSARYWPKSPRPGGRREAAGSGAADAASASVPGSRPWWFSPPPVWLSIGLVVARAGGHPARFAVFFRPARPGLHRPPLRPRQVPDDDRRGGPLRPNPLPTAAPNGVRPAGSRGHQPRRVAGAVECAPRRHEPRRSPAAAHGVPAALHAAQARRHEVRPGLTGWAQVNGRNASAGAERFALDVWYVDHRSLRLDLRILLKSIAHGSWAAGSLRRGTCDHAEIWGPDA